MNIYEAIVVAGIENCQIRRSGWCEGYAIMPTDWEVVETECRATEVKK